MAPSGVAVNAAQVPSPANGFSDMPSTVTGTSARLHAGRFANPIGVQLISLLRKRERGDRKSDEHA
jgi:hypothetical protein